MAILRAPPHFLVVLSVILITFIIPCKTTDDVLILNNSTNVLFQDGNDDTLVSPSETLIWGPGLSPHKIILPARYFFIQLKGKDGKTLRRGQVEKDDLRLRIDCGGDRGVWTQVLEKGGGDASFIVRYKVLTSCTDQFRIIITYRQMHVANSPLIFNLPVHPAGCNCPELEARDWMESVGCSGNYNQLTSDLAPFPNSSVDFSRVLEEIVNMFHRPTSHSFCHYAIIKNQIYRRCYGEHTGFHIFPDAILLFLVRRMWMADVEFVMNLGDWPLVTSRGSSHKASTSPLPIFSWSKTNENLDILLPTYEITEATLEAMGRVSVDMLTVQGNCDVPWEKKIPQLFWRGRDSREERLALVSLGRKNPTLFNVSLTNFFFFRDKEAQYGPKEPHVSFFQFFNYKYQLSIDGTVAAYRFPFLLGGDSVVFKVDSPYLEHFYRDVSPWTHFIPVAPSLDDLVEKVKWAQENDEEARRIGRNGRKYADENLMPLDILCYHATAYHEWSKRLSGGVLIGNGMEPVKQPPTNHHTHHAQNTHNSRSGDRRICNCIRQPPNGNSAGRRSYKAGRETDEGNGKLEL